MSSPTPTSLLVEWASVADATGYTVSFIPGDGACDGVEGGSELVTDRRATGHTLLQLEEFTEYIVQVRSHGGDGVGLPSEPVSQNTLPDGTCAIL